MQRWVGWDKLDHIVLFPRIRQADRDTCPTEPGRRDAVMRDIEAKLGNSNPGACCAGPGRSIFINQSYLDDRNMAVFLSA